MASPAVTDPPGELMYRQMSRSGSSAASSSSWAQIRLAVVSSTCGAEEDDALLEEALVDVAGPVDPGHLVGDRGKDQLGHAGERTASRSGSGLPGHRAAYHGRRRRHLPAAGCGRGESGRRARFRSWSRKGWRFESSRPHAVVATAAAGSPAVGSISRGSPPGRRALRPSRTAARTGSSARRQGGVGDVQAGAQLPPDGGPHRGAQRHQPASGGGRETAIDARQAMGPGPSAGRSSPGPHRSYRRRAAVLEGRSRPSPSTADLFVRRPRWVRDRDG